jgi:hypothetical protein
MRATVAERLVVVDVMILRNLGAAVAVGTSLAARPK